MNTIAIIGGGASGFFCAANIPKNSDFQVIILEKTTKTLSKVKISGGGRCNVTNLKHSDTSTFSQQYPRGERLLKKSLNLFNHQDTVAWFDQEGVTIKMEADGRAFPESNDSQSIVLALEHKCVENETIVLLKKEVILLEQLGVRYILHFTDGAKVAADIVVIATGGYQKEAQYHWQRHVNLPTDAPVPSLFTFNAPGNPITKLMGLATTVKIKIAGTRLQETGPLLITHWGVSGPAVLRLSAWGALKLSELQYQFTAVINWIPTHTEATLHQLFVTQKKASALKRLSSKNLLDLPQRLWLYLLELSDISETQCWADLPARLHNKLVANLLQFQLPISGKTTYKDEFVNAGGIQPSAIDPLTMQTRAYPNLYIIGEALNVDGITGGYNFQHAWTSGYIAAKSIWKNANN